MVTSVVAGKGERADRWRGRWRKMAARRAGDVHGREVQGLGAEGIGEVYAQRRAADGEMEDLAHGGVAQVVERQGVLRFGNLLRCAPGGDPASQRGDGAGACARARALQDERTEAREHRENFQCMLA